MGGLVGEAFRNELTSQYLIMKRDQFEEFKASFTSDNDPIKNEPIQHIMSRENFCILPPGEEIFKLAAKSAMQNIRDSQDNRQDIPELLLLSLKYQVLAQETAFIGIMKQLEKHSGELKQVKIPTISASTRPQQSIPSNYGISQPMLRQGGGMKRSAIGNQTIINTNSSMMTKSKTMLRSTGIQMESRKYEKKDTRGSGMILGSAVMKKQANILEDEEEYSEDFRQKISSASSQNESISKQSSFSRPTTAVSKGKKGSTVQNQSQVHQKASRPQSSVIKTQQESSTLNSLINDQSSVGNWNTTDLIFSYFEENKISEDFERDIKLMLKDKNLYLQVLLTILALFILREKYDDQEDEWIMIAKKAKTYLREQGIEKVDQFYKKINISIRE
ncbi:UNKNOWN [Stylonychia lemnae]|uniref:Uncharacterized protein n=1 Tax=Stylonychia lemnae TaxID=5949 RepID=A0A078ALQ5_STYLE|nr:UNKNOWN [Stylonychia lemnae]|eukprot:CDW82806.1 UNKNOWN [Stylonychia lemnae]